MTSSEFRYFFKITSPSRSVKISSGSPSRIRSVLRISFGITTLPRSSILRTIPVAFINVASLSTELTTYYIAVLVCLNYGESMQHAL